MSYQCDMDRFIEKSPYKILMEMGDENFYFTIGYIEAFRRYEYTEAFMNYRLIDTKDNDYEAKIYSKRELQRIVEHLYIIHEATGQYPKIKKVIRIINNPSWY